MADAPVNAIFDRARKLAVPSESTGGGFCEI